MKSHSNLIRLWKTEGGTLELERTLGNDPSSLAFIVKLLSPTIPQPMATKFHSMSPHSQPHYNNMPPPGS
jgi:hypothetical protein